MMKNQSIILFASLLMLFASCNNNEVDFSYSPEAPASGQAIRFTNLTEEGEEWKWDFGDGTTSSSKSPSKVFKKAGSYTVILKVDDKNSRTCAKTVVIRDSIPAIGISDSIVGYYQTVTISADAYNPYSHDVQYDWTLSEDVHILSGELNEQTLDVFFSKQGENRLTCNLTLGEQTYLLDTIINVVNTPASSLLYTQDLLLYRQRIYDNGFEEPVCLGPIANQGDYVSSLQSYADIIYACACAQQTATITRGQLQAGKLTLSNIRTINTTAPAYGYLNGEAFQYVYADRINSGATAAEELGLSAGLQTRGAALYNGNVIYAYADAIYAFPQSQPTADKLINIAHANADIQAMAIDPISQKVYFFADALYVININGSCCVEIPSQANGKALVVDAPNNLLFYTTNQGVMAMPLIHTGNNTGESTHLEVNTNSNITALAPDHTLR